MIIKALGGCCKKSTLNYERVKEVVQQMKCNCEVIHVSDPIEIAKLGCMATPGIAINDKVVVSGIVLSVDQIRDLLLKNGCQAAQHKCECGCEDEGDNDCCCDDECCCGDEEDHDCCKGKEKEKCDCKK